MTFTTVSLTLFSIMWICVGCLIGTFVSLFIFKSDTKKPQAEFGIGDIVIEHFNIEDPFRDNICYIIVDKKQNESGKIFYQYKCCDKNGHFSRNSLDFSGDLNRCFLVGHKDLTPKEN